VIQVIPLGRVKSRLSSLGPWANFATFTGPTAARSEYSGRRFAPTDAPRKSDSSTSSAARSHPGMRQKIASDNAEDFKQGAKINKASVSRRECVGTLLKIPLC